MNLWPLTGFTIGAVVLAIITVGAFLAAPSDPGPMEGDHE
jgi:hypothetical protein